MSARDLIEGEALLDDEEGDESYDDETGEPSQPRKQTAAIGGANQDGFDDSSEEEDDDDDEEAARAVREGFIIDDEEEEEDRAQRKRERRKRRREERERENEDLDEEDLDLIGELTREPAGEQSKFKRLKRGHKSDRDQGPAGLDDIFNSDEEDEAAELERDTGRLGRQGLHDEFDGFIEEDVFSDDEDRERLRDEEEVARPSRKGLSGIGLGEATGLDASALEDMRQAFGDGMDYWFALEKEDQDEMMEDEEKRLDLKDVFEPSQLAEKMLTDEDNEIRFKDEPERFQIARKPYRHVVLTDEQFREEAVWISNAMMLRRRVEPSYQEPFQKAVSKVLEFMTIDNFEVPFIFQHRKDYLIHTEKTPITPDPRNPDQPEFKVTADKLLNMVDLWDIFDLDLKYRAMIDKRNTLQKTYDNLQQVSSIQDDIIDELLPAANSMDELQDLQDYLYFQYSSQIKDLAVINGAETNGESNGHQRRKAPGKTFFDRVRNGNVYNVVRAFGITADAFARNAAREGKRQYTEDPTERPDDLADSVLDSDFSNGAQALKAAKAMFAEELTMNPRMRKTIRLQYFKSGVIECYRTEKGFRKIDEHHPYYEFKYLRNQYLTNFASKPEMYLRMMKAEEEGLVDVKVRFKNIEDYKKDLYKEIESDNFSEVADAWNRERREVLDLAITKLEKVMVRSVKENMKAECENSVARICRDAFTAKLDQAPYKPKGMALGTIPRVLALSNGNGVVGKDQIAWAWVEDDGRVLENGKFTDLTCGDRERMISDGKDVRHFVDLVNRRQPDVIGISGFSPETRKLYNQLVDLIKVKDLRGAEYEDNEGDTTAEPLEVVIVNDEVARLYQTSDRAKMEHPSFASLTHYCVALAKYLQNPLKEYASLGRDVASITFHPGQQLVPQDKLLKQLESALVDMVNLCGVEINDAVSDSYVANLLPYICGLGPRKATQLVKTINMNGGVVSNRTELLGGVESQRFAAMGPNIWNNAVSFLYITFESTDLDFDYLDNTRVHPEDYDIGRKMAADALELDEEDIKAEVDEYGPGAIVRKLRKDEATDRVNDLILEEYAEQLEKNLNQRKRATLETIRAELQEPYEELRQKFSYMTTDAIFTMFTGETPESLSVGMVVSMSIKRITEDHIDGKLDCGIDALVPEMELTDRHDIPIKSVFSIHQTVQAKVLNISRKSFTAQVSLRESEITRPYRRQFDHMRDEWDDRQEQKDKEALQEKTDEGGRAVRVVKHPDFRPFNSRQAEEYLGARNRGDVVIRPSSKGNDHLAVTWKVSDGVFQHIDVLELDKENDFSLGKTLKVGRYTYSDLDELIALHIQAMARKVDEMIGHDKFQNGSKTDTERWLTTYTEANPKRSVYAFCINPKYPGYFFLCFKAGQNAQLQNWPVKVIPGGFELQRSQYQSMKDLCNGFKIMFASMQANKRPGGR